MTLAMSISSTGRAQQRGIAVYLNDVRLDGGELRGQTLSNVDVRFDDNGDVRIIAKGYKVTAEPVGPSAGGATPVAAMSAPATGLPRLVRVPAGRKYYVVPQQPEGRTGMAQWDVDLYVNNAYVHRFKSKEPDPMFELTSFLRPGPNSLRFVARKEVGDRISQSPTDYMDLLIGDGQMQNGQLYMSRLATYRRTAAETGSYTTETTLELTAPVGTAGQ